MTRMNGNIGFVEDIRNLVSEAERNCMSSVPRGSFDLHVWKDVRDRGDLILRHLRGENGLTLMPPGGWPPAKTETFESWLTEGTPKRRGEYYSEYFRAIDAQTEYFDVYGSAGGLENMAPFFSQFFGRGKLLNTSWKAYMDMVPSTPILERRKEQLWDQVIKDVSNPSVKESLLKIDEFILNLVVQFFGQKNDKVDQECLFDAYENFGRDSLPIDEDRVKKVEGLGNPNDYRLVNDFARFHRMDSRVMWFFWFGHLQCVKGALGEEVDSRHDLRTLLLAAIFTGQTIDAAFRQGSNNRTRAAYKGKDGLENIRATAKIIATDWDTGVAEMEDLYWIWSGKKEPT